MIKFIGSIENIGTIVLLAFIIVVIAMVVFILFSRGSRKKDYGKTKIANCCNNENNGEEPYEVYRRLRESNITLNYLGYNNTDYEQ